MKWHVLEGQLSTSVLEAVTRWPRARALAQPSRVPATAEPAQPDALSAQSVFLQRRVLARDAASSAHWSRLEDAAQPEASQSRQAAVPASRY